MSNTDLQTARHSLSHIMAQAVQELFPGTRLGIGPAIENGFYYDFESDHKFVPEDLKAIEAKMKEIIKAKQPFACKNMPKAEAVKFFSDKGEHFKVELINELEDGSISVYTNGDFVDLCKGPHVEHTGKINNFKLTHIAGAYWKGDEKRPMLQRIYGLAFETKDKLNEYIKQQEEAAKRDHRKLGIELDLFSISEDIGPGLILMHPKGGMLRKVVEDWIRDENIKHGYDLVYSPHIARLHLWQKSGHANFYSENMFQPIEVDDQQYQLKPMNCPFHIAIYESHLRSYRDLPVRLAELGTVYRYERSGVVHGLLRVRGFTQDDAHIFCTPEQMNGEIEDCFNFAMLVMKTFGFEKFSVELSTWDETKPENYTGGKKDWEEAQNALESVLKKNNVPFTVHAGEAAFYGPKIDIKVMDAIGRYWQLSTIQFDFNLPQKFELEYVSPEGRKRPLMVHRALLGSIERFLGVLIEHYAGLFPLWLAPVQVKLLTLTDDQFDFAKDVVKQMKLAGLRAELDSRPEKLGLKIREAHVEKIPYSIVIGAKEAENKTLTLRLRSGKNVEGLSVGDVIAKLKEEADTKSLKPLFE
ncbi:Threonyl-tRNA synthetase [Elusimicrobium minutum Pei191]|uniref:Threonine--tRNA ligase n=1 Tax=Elusimicrobium minutum (strain Pei191) TaxID=445932 RepID=B2KBZ4_ELUMP|nr:threonine--tRNA ligase [Elusimicrobium minutum]ACC98121.1 Threonyl-tRNA synthetase [Elusimicrobium minutum Pei191]